MDTKAQNFPITHSNSRPQSHCCNHCDCSHHCLKCSQSCSWSQSCSQSSSQSPTSHSSPPGRQSWSPRPSPLPKHQKHTMHSHHCPMRPTTHSRSYHPKNRKTLEGNVNKRKVGKRNQRVHRTKRRSSGRKCN